MRLNDIALQHHAWIVSVGWDNPTTLEALARMGSELGEMGEESFEEGVLPPNFGEELADAVLRAMGQAVEHGIDLDAAVRGYSVIWRSATLQGRLVQLMVVLARCVNAARKDVRGEAFAHSLGGFVALLVSLAERTGVDLRAELAHKMAINEQRGTRGRPI
jgi:hypothetical protein